MTGRFSRDLRRLLAMVAVLVAASGCWMSAGAGDGQEASFAVAPDGERIIFAADGDLYLMTIATRAVSALGPTEERESHPRFAPDGRSIVYAAQPRDRPGTCLFERTLDGPQPPRRLTDDPAASDITPSFSADGKRVVFARAPRRRPYSMGGMTWDQYDICAIGRDGTGLRRLTKEGYYQADSPGFVADGGVVFAGSGTYPDTGTYLLKVAADGSRPPDRLTSPPAGAKLGAWASEPAVAADGRRVALVSDRTRPFHYDVFVADADGANARPLGVTTIGRYNQGPMFLPGDRGVAFLAGTSTARSRGHRYELWVAPLDGGPPSRLADSTLFDDPTRWRPAAEAPPAAPGSNP